MPNYLYFITFGNDNKKKILKVGITQELNERIKGNLKNVKKNLNNKLFPDCGELNLLQLDAIIIRDEIAKKAEDTLIDLLCNERFPRPRDVNEFFYLSHCGNEIYYKDTENNEQKARKIWESFPKLHERFLYKNDSHINVMTMKDMFINYTRDYFLDRSSLKCVARTGKGKRCSNDRNVFSRYCSTHLNAKNVKDFC